ELFVSALAQGKGRQYAPMSRFPKVTQDMTLRVASTVPHAELHAFITTYIHDEKQYDYIANVQGTDIYQGEDKSSKNITFRIIIGSHERTLTDEEIHNLLDQVATTAKETFGAERI
ncbi:MAG: hypothetical protein AAB834_03295, partial [Patescibacteria group bacterium]